MKIKRSDTVRVMAGKFKGKIAKVVKVYPKANKITLEGINIIKRNVKPSQLNPQGGTKEVHTPIAISNVALVVDGKEATSRISYDIRDDGSKVRIARQAGNKEIK